MPAYVFPRERGPALRDDVIRMVMLPARAQTSRSHHAAVGDDVFLKLAARGNQPVEDVGADPRRCILRARLVLTAATLVRVIYVSYREADAHAGAAQVFANIIAGAEQGAPGEEAHRHTLSALAGFDSWADLYRHLARKTASGDIGDRLDRELIVWGRA